MSRIKNAHQQGIVHSAQGGATGPMNPSESESMMAERIYAQSQAADLHSGEMHIKRMEEMHEGGVRDARDLQGSYLRGFYTEFNELQGQVDEFVEQAVQRRLSPERSTQGVHSFFLRGSVSPDGSENTDCL